MAPGSPDGRNRAASGRPRPAAAPASSRRSSEAVIPLAGGVTRRHAVGVANPADGCQYNARSADADVEALSLHDCHIHGIELRTGDSNENDWTHDLCLDIDFIIDGRAGSDGRWTFRVAPAWLVFSEVTDLRIAIDWGTEGAGFPIHPVSIGELVRRPVDVSPDRPRPVSEWRIEMNWPEGSQIRFWATSFTLQLRTDPVETDARQHLSTAQRRRHL